MAQAGFYHSPSSNGDDRAMCFTCNVCLVSWEPTDEPWSEHERHSPFCPFVRGEHTHNVPLSLSFATGPAFIAAERGSILPILGKSSCPVAIVVAYSNGHITVWDVAREPKVCKLFILLMLAKFRFVFVIVRLIHFHFLYFSACRAFHTYSRHHCVNNAIR